MDKIPAISASRVCRYIQLHRGSKLITDGTNTITPL